MAFLTHARYPFSLPVREKLARQRGEIYLAYARRSLMRGDQEGARLFAERGLRVAVGPYYLPVVDKLSALLDSIHRG